MDVVKFFEVAKKGWETVKAIAKNKEIAIKGWEAAKAVLKNPGVQNAIAAGTSKGIDILSNNSISFEKKLKKLDKLKKSSMITEEEYQILRKKLIDAQ